MHPSRWSRKSSKARAAVAPALIATASLMIRFKLSTLRSRTLLARIQPLPKSTRPQPAKRNPRQNNNHSKERRSFMSRQPGTYATFDTTEGKIVCRLFEAEAPITVKNFTDLAEGKRSWKDSVSGKGGDGPLYSGTIFHRVIPDFMIQGGDPSGTGMGGPGYKFGDETKGSPHKFDKAGKLAMANAGPGTNGSQFFITVAATPWLTGNHTIFGEVIEGQDVADKISKVKKGAQDRPVTQVTINSIAIERVS
jgi:peptidyl-prolyl cis-trans isomerase A (cyclophilin A)